MEGHPPPRAICAAPRRLGALAQPGLDVGGQAGGPSGLPPQIRAGGGSAGTLSDGGGMSGLGLQGGNDERRRDSTPLCPAGHLRQDRGGWEGSRRIEFIRRSDVAAEPSP
ncbi:hypothetical protein MPLB_220005 [Mesorhizobium sp. ORS 3324]|nr:hypothetical protein MPLB_220005 [Mesorhizobium sp. ORS 3324]